MKGKSESELTWNPSDSSIPFTREEGAGEFEREFGLELALELDLDDARELDWETWAWAMREAEVGRELDEVCFCIESAFVILDRGAKMPDDWEIKSETVWLKLVSLNKKF